MSNNYNSNTGRNTHNNYNNNSSGGGGGGRGGRNRGGGRSNYRGGGGGGGGGRYHGQTTGGGRGGYDGGPPPKFKPCKAWTTTGSCPNGNQCNFAHIVQIHAVVDASSPLPNVNSSSSNSSHTDNINNKSHSNNYNGPTNTNHHNNNNNPSPPVKMAPVSAVAIWETNQQIKIFTGSLDGYWRLWNTSGGNFVKEFEQNMGGFIGCLHIVNNLLFCGFEATPTILPTSSVGMVHIWNLHNPSLAPLELHVHEQQMPYAHNQCTTSLFVTATDVPKVVSGSKDGSIRLWSLENNAFKLVLSLPGHARDVTGLVLLDNPSHLLWSCGADGAIRIWNLNDGSCQLTISSGSLPPTIPAGGAPLGTAAAAAAAIAGLGHTNAVTSLLQYQSPAGTFLLSSSLDGTIKAWNGTNGECVASETHGKGVVSMSLAKDQANHDLLLIGLESGNIMCRNLVQSQATNAFALLFTLSAVYTLGHHGPVQSLAMGPAATFYSGGDDGKLMVFQFTGDLGI